MPYSEIPTFMAELRGHTDTSGRALEWCILTATRTSEAIGAKRAEVDRAAALWRIPADRMKANRPHEVPLSPRALAIFDAMPEQVGNPYLFPGAIEGKPLSEMALLEKLRGMLPAGSDYVVHGFR